MDKITESAADYGLGGLVIVALFYLLHFVMRSHEGERGAWLKAYQENTEVLRMLTERREKPRD